MRASGAGGMIGGQLLDLEGEGRPLALDGARADPPREDRRADHAPRRRSAARAARRAADAARRRSARYGEAIGLAFQIADDVLDVTATTDQLGKTAGRDLDAAKEHLSGAARHRRSAKRAPPRWSTRAAPRCDEVGLLTPRSGPDRAASPSSARS